MLCMFVTILNHYCVARANQKVYVISYIPECHSIAKFWNIHMA